MITLIAALPFGVLLLGLAIGGGAAYFFLGGRQDGPPPLAGTVVAIGTVGDLEVVVRQQTSDSLEWLVSRQGATEGTGAGKYTQGPITAMLEFAFTLVGKTAPVTLTFPMEGAVGRAKEHGDTTVHVEIKGGVWSWSAADVKHNVFAIGETPSRGASLIKAEQAVGEHQNIVVQGFGPTPPADPQLPGPPKPKGEGPGGFGVDADKDAEVAHKAYGIVVKDSCHVELTDEAEWMNWAKPRIGLAFDDASGIPTGADLIDAVLGDAMAAAGIEGCDVEDITIGAGVNRPALDVEASLDQLLAAIQEPDYLSIPAPDEMMAAALGGAPIDNRGHKEYAGSWGIVVRPTDALNLIVGPEASPYRWWAFNGPRLTDQDADAHGEASSEAEGIALAKAAVAALEGS